MKLISIELNNFRQYYGENNKIEFANSDGSDITVILGQNGCGKTGIFRAMMFCLYGLEKIAEDEDEKDNDSKRIDLVNLHALEENIGKKVEASVKVIFENEGKTYIVVRKMYELMKEDVKEIIKCSNSKVSMDIIDEYGNLDPNTKTNEEEIEEILEDILNPKLKDFFFFNGDKIESLARTNSKSRKEIKSGIIKLLQIDNLEKSVSILEKMLADQKKKIYSSASTKWRENHNKQEEIKEEIEEAKNDLDNLTEELDSANNQLEKLKQKMKENEAVKSLWEEDEKLEQKIREEKDKLNSNKERFKDLLNNSLANNLMFNYIEISKKKLKDRDETVYIPELLIDKILEEKVCICGTHIDEDQDNYQLLKNYKNSLKSESRKFYTGWLEEIDKYIGRKNILENNLEKDLKSVSDEKSYIETLEENRKNVREKIKEFNNTSKNELVEYQKDFEKREKEIDKLKLNIAIKKHTIENKKEELNNYQEEEKMIEQQEEKNKVEQKKKEYLNQLYEMFEKIKQDYINDVKEKLSNEMYRIFKELIEDKDKDLIGKITVNDNYEIDVRNWQDISILQDISSGQKHIISLSLIIALSKLACNEDGIINVPLFMDTPLGKISMENRKHIINAIPNEMEQWILLVTDTEMTSTEMEYLYKTNKWHKFYKLEQKDKGKTQIVEIKDISSQIY